MPHRAAGWRIEPPVSVPSDSGASHAATAAAVPPLTSRRGCGRCPTGCGVGLVRAVLGGRAHGELVHVRLADDDRVRGLQPLDDVGVVGRQEVLEHLAAQVVGIALRAEHVLDRDRHAGERAERLPRLALGVDGRGLPADVGLVHVHERLDLRLAVADGGEEGVGDLGGRGLPGGLQGEQFGGGLLDQVMAESQESAQSDADGHVQIRAGSVPAVYLVPACALACRLVDDGFVGVEHGGDAEVVAEPAAGRSAAPRRPAATAAARRRGRRSGPAAGGPAARRRRCSAAAAGRRSRGCGELRRPSRRGRPRTVRAGPSLATLRTWSRSRDMGRTFARSGNGESRGAASRRPRPSGQAIGLRCSCMLNGWTLTGLTTRPLRMAAADTHTADGLAVDDALHLLQVRLELPAAGAGDLLADAAEVLGLTAVGLLVARRPPSGR